MNGTIGENTDKFKEFVERHKWTFAKSYAHKSPHEYIVLGRVNATKDEFVWAAKFIREYGFWVYYWKKPWKVYHLDGHMYWTMDQDVNDTGLINRNSLADYSLNMRVEYVYGDDVQRE